MRKGLYAATTLYALFLALVWYTATNNIDAVWFRLTKALPFGDKLAHF